MEGEEAAVAAAEERVGVGAVAVGRAIGEVGLLPQAMPLVAAGPTMLENKKRLPYRSFRSLLLLYLY